MASGSESETEVEGDDIITYDTETSRYTTVANQEHHIVCNHHRINNNASTMSGTQDMARPSG